MPNRKVVLHYDENENFIEKFNSTCEAEKVGGYLQISVSRWCRGKVIPKNRHIWRYENE